MNGQQTVNPALDAKMQKILERDESQLIARAKRELWLEEQRKLNLPPPDRSHFIAHYGGPAVRIRPSDAPTDPAMAELSKFVFHCGGMLEALPCGVLVHSDARGAAAHVPATRQQELQAKVLYATVKVNRAEKAFHRLKDVLQGRGHSFHWGQEYVEEFGPPPAGGIAQLEALRDHVLARRQTLNELQEQYDKLPEVVEARQRAEQESQDRQRRELADAQSRAQQEQRIADINI